MSRQSQSSQRSLTRPGSVGGLRPAEHSKDFAKAYRGLVQKMYKEQGGLCGLLTEDELIAVEAHKKLSEKEFLERSMAYLQKRDEKL